VVAQEDVVHLEVGAVAEEALEVIVVAGALEVAEEDSVSAVAEVVAAVVSGEVVVVFEGHDIVLVPSKHKSAPPRSFKNVGLGAVTPNWPCPGQAAAGAQLNSGPDSRVQLVDDGIVRNLLVSILR
jgi:hypothetical protein